MCVKSFQPTGVSFSSHTPLSVCVRASVRACGADRMVTVTQVQVGDVVLTVRGIALRGVVASEVPALLDGPAGSAVMLGLQVRGREMRYGDEGECASSSWLQVRSRVEPSMKNP